MVSQRGLTLIEVMLVLTVGISVTATGLWFWNRADEHFAQRRLVQQQRIIMQTIGDIHWEYNAPAPHAHTPARAKNRVRAALPPSLQAALDHNRFIISGFAQGVSLSATALSYGECVYLLLHPTTPHIGRPLDMARPPGGDQGPPNRPRQPPAGPLHNIGSTLPAPPATPPSAAAVTACMDAANNLSWYWYNTPKTP